MEELKSLADLLDLQAVDLEIDRLLDERQSLPELDQYRATDASLKQLKQQRAAATDRVKELALAIDKTSGELQLTEAKHNAEQNRLYAGGLSARDADYLRQEVEMLGRRMGEMEEQTLELMERKETEDAELERLSGEVASAETEKVRLEGIITTTWKEIDAEIARKEERKGVIAPLIEEDLRDLYDDLRNHKDGVGVARLGEGVCGACHLTLSNAEQLDAKREDPPRCVHCRRILVL